MTTHFSYLKKPEPCPEFHQSGIVSETLQPHRIGVVKFRGRWLAAVCPLPITLHPDTAVKVVEDYGEYVSVLPFAE